MSWRQHPCVGGTERGVPSPTAVRGAAYSESLLGTSHLREGFPRRVGVPAPCRGGQDCAIWSGKCHTGRPRTIVSPEPHTQDPAARHPCTPILDQQPALRAAQEDPQDSQELWQNLMGLRLWCSPQIWEKTFICCPRDKHRDPRTPGVLGAVRNSVPCGVLLCGS